MNLNDPLCVIPLLAASAIAITTFCKWLGRCTGRTGIKRHCLHHRYFNKTDPHGTLAGQVSEGWCQRLVSVCCYCGEFESGWDQTEFNPGITPTYDNKEAAKWKAGLEDDR